MKTKNVEYKIPLNTLKEGIHELSYRIEQKFIEDFKIEGILNADLDLTVIFTKRELLHNLEFSIEGTLSVECDRCLEPLNIYIDTEDSVVIKSSENTERFENTDEVIVIHPQDIEIDFTQFVYETLRLALPLQNIHLDGECNEDMLQYISEEEEKEENKTDSRWDSLKNLLDN